MACGLGRSCSGFAPREKGVIDATLAGLIALAATCAALLAGGLPL
jgi:hypothetical protein